MRLIQYRYPNPSARFTGNSRFSPWNGLENEIDRLFSAALSDMATPASADRFPVDLYQDDKHAYVRAALPGVERDSIQVEVVDGFLNLAVERKTKVGEKETTSRRNRSVKLADEVQADGITAIYEHGVLTVTLPKKVPAEPRKIAVKVS